MDDGMKNKVTLKIPHELYVSLQGMIKDTGFSSVNEFVVFVLRTIAKGGSIGRDTALNHDDIERVKKRLSELGYL